jgi:hypothetical protein
VFRLDKYHILQLFFIITQTAHLQMIIATTDELIGAN